MENSQLECLVEKAQKGDEKSREKILHHFRSYVLNVASRVSRRYLTWSDDETSVGLFAMNKAIDRFNSNLGKSFLNFSYLLISQEIIDFFRKERRHQNLSLQELPVIGDEEDTMEDSFYEREVAAREHSLKEEHQDLMQEIFIYQEELEQYGLSFEELPDHSPKHKDTRENCFNLAFAIVNNEDLIQQIRLKRRLPITELARATGTSPKTIEKNKRYILAVTLLLLNPDLERLKTFIQKGGEEE